MWHLRCLKITCNVDVITLFVGISFHSLLDIIRITPNVALRGTATQSTTYTQSNYRASPFVASYANDGHFETSMIETSEIGCTITRNIRPVWWQVDLLQVHDITKVAISGRKEHCKYGNKRLFLKFVS